MKPRKSLLYQTGTGPETENWKELGHLREGGGGGDKNGNVKLSDMKPIFCVCPPLFLRIPPLPNKRDWKNSLNRCCYVFLENCPSQKTVADEGGGDVCGVPACRRFGFDSPATFLLKPEKEI